MTDGFCKQHQGLISLDNRDTTTSHDEVVEDLNTYSAGKRDCDLDTDKYAHTRIDAIDIMTGVLGTGSWSDSRASDVDLMACARSAPAADMSLLSDMAQWLVSPTAGFPSASVDGSDSVGDQKLGENVKEEEGSHRRGFAPAVMAEPHEGNLVASIEGEMQARMSPISWAVNSPSSPTCATRGLKDCMASAVVDSTINETMIKEEFANAMNRPLQPQASLPGFAIAPGCEGGDLANLCTLIGSLSSHVATASGGDPIGLVPPCATAETDPAISLNSNALAHSYFLGSQPFVYDALVPDDSPHTSTVYTPYLGDLSPVVRNNAADAIIVSPHILPPVNVNRLRKSTAPEIPVILPHSVSAGEGVSPPNVYAYGPTPSARGNISSSYASFPYIQHPVVDVMSDLDPSRQSRPIDHTDGRNQYSLQPSHLPTPTQSLNSDYLLSVPVHSHSQQTCPVDDRSDMMPFTQPSGRSSFTGGRQATWHSGTSSTVRTHSSDSPCSVESNLSLLPASTLSSSGHRYADSTNDNNPNTNLTPAFTDGKNLGLSAASCQRINVNEPSGVPSSTLSPKVEQTRSTACSPYGKPAAVSTSIFAPNKRARRGGGTPGYPSNANLPGGVKGLAKRNPSTCRFSVSFQPPEAENLGIDLGITPISSAALSVWNSSGLMVATTQDLADHHLYGPSDSTTSAADMAASLTPAAPMKSERAGPTNNIDSLYSLAGYGISDTDSVTTGATNLCRQPFESDTSAVDTEANGSFASNLAAVTSSAGCQSDSQVNQFGLATVDFDYGMADTSSSTASLAYGFSSLPTDINDGCRTPPRGHRASSQRYGKRIGRPRIDRSNTKCEKCGTTSTPQWRYLSAPSLASAGVTLKTTADGDVSRLTSLVDGKIGTTTLAEIDPDESMARKLTGKASQATTTAAGSPSFGTIDGSNNEGVSDQNRSKLCLCNACWLRVHKHRQKVQGRQRASPTMKPQHGGDSFPPVKPSDVGVSNSSSSARQGTSQPTTGACDVPLLIRQSHYSTDYISGITDNPVSCGSAMGTGAESNTMNPGLASETGAWPPQHLGTSDAETISRGSNKTQHCQDPSGISAGRTGNAEGFVEVKKSRDSTTTYGGSMIGGTSFQVDSAGRQLGEPFPASLPSTMLRPGPFITLQNGSLQSSVAYTQNSSYPAAQPACAYSCTFEGPFPAASLSTDPATGIAAAAYVLNNSTPNSDVSSGSPEHVDGVGENGFFGDPVRPAAPSVQPTAYPFTSVFTAEALYNLER